jgi:phospholipid transport system substrate-binding protein
MVAPMKKHYLPMSLATLLLAGALVNLAPAADLPAAQQLAVAEAPAPEAVIARAIADLSELINLKADMRLDSPEFRDQVGRVLTPYVDIELMTQLAAGKYWRAASQQQRMQLASEYRLLLIAIYSVPLKSLRESQVAVRLLGQSQENKRAKVRVDVLQSSNTPIELVFSLYTKDNHWRVYDMSVEGISLTNNYRSEFSAIISRQGMDALIAQLSDKNRKTHTGS